MTSLAPEDRSHWYETHLDHAKRFGTTVSEQLVITAQMADVADGTQRAVGLLNQLEEFIDAL